ncbi:MAG TPA: hypothetical protein VMI54_12910 [Polyangiaceae bacterium]|nr:hypothetical protein [Polyangiaceae bacterium]
MSISLQSSPLIVAGVLTVLGVAFGAAAAESAEPCSGPSIHLELDSEPEWAAEIPALRARLRELEHVDGCARVVIRSAENGVSVDVTSGGRSASRLLTDPAELVRTVEALVVLPPEIAARARVDASEVPPNEPAPAPPAPVPSRMELGGGGSLRLGGSPLMVGGGVAAFADLADDGWLFGVDARWEFADGFVSAPAPNGFDMDSGAVGVGVGRRVQAGSVAADLLVGPTVVFESEEAFGPVAGPSDGIDASALDARIDATVRASGPASSRVRLYAAGDLEVSPRRALHKKELDPNLPPLPAWTSGLSLGVIWGTR